MWLNLPHIAEKVHSHWLICKNCNTTFMHETLLCSNFLYITSMATYVGANEDANLN